MFKQVELSYGAGDLEPNIDALTIETHYGKHHATYTKTFNEAVEKAGLTDKSAEEILASLDSVEDEGLRKVLRNNGGGYYNHNMYFEAFSANPKAAPEGELKTAIDETFGSLDALKDELTKLALGQFGSGWAWLSADTEGKLYVSNSPNQDNPISEKKGYMPILALDVWEHAYYLNYKNLRGDYIKAYFNVLDWGKIEENYKKVCGK